ncbi:MAG: glucosamine-6-phosphate deaminase [Firmicutes bacterium HGW-Firmicutes-5]|nr:MAG: glucosamine-6-phosphate deaminase [Firmicutes bacterium HGW-Firmicutes-5]
MTIFVKENYAAMSKKAANIVAGQVNLKPDSVLGLATGSTPEGMYRELVELYKEDRIDFSEVTTFNLDEYYGLPIENNQSYAYYMNKNFFSQVNISSDNIHIPNSISNNLAVVCEAYDRLIEINNNIDLQILGIGNNGHIGFNEPDVKFEASTHLVELDEDTIEANARFFESVDDVPRQAISMGIRNIMHTKKIILMANGANKASILKEMLFGPVTPNVPASVIQLHNDVTIILEKEAAKYVLEELKVRGVVQ